MHCIYAYTKVSPCNLLKFLYIPDKDLCGQNVVLLSILCYMKCSTSSVTFKSVAMSLNHIIIIINNKEVTMGEKWISLNTYIFAALFQQLISNNIQLRYQVIAYMSTSHTNTILHRAYTSWYKMLAIVKKGCAWSNSVAFKKSDFANFESVNKAVCAKHTASNFKAVCIDLHISW